MKKLLVVFNDTSYVRGRLKSITNEPVVVNALNGVTAWIIHKKDNPHLNWVTTSNHNLMTMGQEADNDIVLVMEK